MTLKVELPYTQTVEPVFVPVVVRTPRGLSVRGTRITLYQIMDYIKAGLSNTDIREDFNLSYRDVDEIFKYIEENEEDFENEYQRIVKQNEEERRYWEEYNRERFERIAKTPRNPKYKVIWDKINENRKRRGEHEFIQYEVSV
ncbi:MAG: DUF433 domain-containing protein [Chloroflexota bacterium]